MSIVNIGYEAEMNVRQREGMEPVEVFTTTDESIVLTTGNISLSLDEITAPSGSYNYDLKITKGGKSRTIITGYFTIRPEL